MTAAELREKVKRTITSLDSAHADATIKVVLKAACEACVEENDTITINGAEIRRRIRSLMPGGGK